MIGLEDALLDQRLLIVGKSGFGKTNVAKGSGVEKLLSKGRRVGILDPTDSWFGLRLKPDGKTPAFKVVIFGGEHGDLPLNENAGAAMGRALAKASDSWIISLSEMKTESARERFGAAFLDALYDYNRAPLHLVVDEAETFAPQKTATPLQTTMTARLNQIVKRGRKRGFRTWLISQRPADLSKSVSSQADVVVSLALTLPHDRKAIMDYVKDHDEDGTAGDLFKAMPKLARGEGIVWWPGGGILDRRRFPLTKTFDSGKTPEAGDPVAKLAPLKVDALAKTLADVVAEAEATSVPKLQARIRELEAAVKKPAAATPIVDIEREKSQADRSGYARGMVDAAKVAGDTLLAIQNRLAEAVAQARNELMERSKVASEAATGRKAIHTPIYAARVPTPPPIDTARLPIAVQRKTAAVDGDASLRPGERKILTALAQYAPEQLRHSRTAALCVMSESGGTFKTYAGRLRALGLMTPGNPATITPEGLRALGDYEALPRGEALFEHWRSQVRPGEAKLLEALRAGNIDPEDVAAFADMTTGGGTYKTYMGRLRKLGIVVGSPKTGLQLHEDLQGA